MHVQMHEARIFAARIPATRIPATRIPATRIPVTNIFAANILRSHRNGDLIAWYVTMAELIDDSSGGRDEQSSFIVRRCE
jgi:hypothetical protein